MYTIDLGGPATIWGYIPSFLEEGAEGSAREQIARNYIGGWHSFSGFKLDSGTMELSYPDDPSMRPLNNMRFRDEVLWLYPHAWLLIMQPDGSWEIAHID